MDKPIQLIVFKMEGENYGIDISETKEILRLKELNIMEFPKAPNFIEGLMNLRGEVIPVVNLRKRLGMEVNNDLRNGRVVILKIEKKKIGVILDNIIKTLELEENEIDYIPEEMKDRDNKYIHLVAKKDDDIITIFDMKELLNIHEENR